jgi:hypothetical protein
MRRSCRILTSVLAVPLLGIMLLAGCEGPQGPVGAGGADGADGAAGPQGPAGQDAAGTCVQCHTSDMYLLARQVQYAASARTPRVRRLGGLSLRPAHHAMPTRALLTRWQRVQLRLVQQRLTNHPSTAALVTSFTQHMVQAT